MKNFAIALTAFMQASLASSQAQQEADRPTAVRTEGVQKIEEKFPIFDQNTDGFINWTEWKAVIGNQISDGGNSEAGLREAFAIVDSSKDGLVSKREFTDWLMQTFDCLDDNHDGTVMKSEYDRNGGKCFK